MRSYLPATFRLWSAPLREVMPQPGRNSPTLSTFPRRSHSLPMRKDSSGGYHCNHENDLRRQYPSLLQTLPKATRLRTQLPKDLPFRRLPALYGNCRHQLPLWAHCLEISLSSRTRRTSPMHAHLSREPQLWKTSMPRTLLSRRKTSRGTFETKGQAIERCSNWD
jgi:hypothetical protein